MYPKTVPLKIQQQKSHTATFTENVKVKAPGRQDEKKKKEKKLRHPKVAPSLRDECQ